MISPSRYLCSVCLWKNKRIYVNILGTFLYKILCKYVGKTLTPLFASLRSVWLSSALWSYCVYGKINVQKIAASKCINQNWVISGLCIFDMHQTLKIIQTHIIYSNQLFLSTLGLSHLFYQKMKFL